MMHFTTATANALICLILLHLTSGALVKSSEKNEEGFFWHFTDFHLDMNYNSHCKQAMGDYNCDSSYALVNEAFKNAVYVRENPDFIVWSGDSGAHNSSLSQDEIFNEIKVITNAMKNQFPAEKTTIIPLIGNHDSFSENLMSPKDNDPKRIAWCEKLGALWSDLLEPKFFEAEMPTIDFNTTCASSQIVRKPEGNKPGLLVLAINGLVWYKGNKLAKKDPKQLMKDYDPLHQFKWIKESFEWARNNGYKIITANHFPLGVVENFPTWPHLILAANQRLVQIYREYHDVLITALVAHEHVDSFRVIMDEQGKKPVGTMFLTPSITPYKMYGFGAFNPRLRSYTYDQETLKLNGYSQSFINISKSYPTWTGEYGTEYTYNLKDLGADNMFQLLNLFKTEDDHKGYWSNYWNSEFGGGERLTKYKECPYANGTCRCEHVCAMMHVDMEHLANCLHNCDPSPSPKPQPKPHSSQQRFAIIIAVSCVIAGLILIFVIAVVVTKVILPRMRDQNRLV